MRGDTTGRSLEEYFLATIKAYPKSPEASPKDAASDPKTISRKT